ncbi:MAG: hypothetical protein HFI53_04180 [Lachnospiraceae bacterium]|nr:hypothetical protein [Lachnospiraceae bacterium]
MGKAGRILIRTFLVFAGLAAVMGAVAVFLVHKSMDYEISPEEMKEQAVWEREVLPQLDALFEESCVEDEYGVYLDYDTAKKKVRQYVKERNR